MRSTVYGLAAVGLMAFASTVQADPWETPSGTLAHFTHANGGDVNGLFGEPVTFGNTLNFTNANFQVNAVNGGAETQWDTVSLDVASIVPLLATGVVVTAFGSHSLVGEGSSVDLDAELILTENGGLNRSWIRPLFTNASFPIEFESNGTWFGSALIDLAIEFPVPGPVTDFQVSFSLEVAAMSGSSGACEINVQHVDLYIQAWFPEPTSLGLLAVGGLSLLRRRR